MSRQPRRTPKDIFLDELRNVAKGEDEWVNNSVLRKRFSWRKDKYDQVKQDLIDSGAVVPGPGRSGRVKLSRTEPKAVKVFISYCHADKEIKEDLLKHMLPLKRLNMIETWTDLEILPGDEWDKEISNSLASADIVLLLVSIDFINSEYCYNVELEQANKRYQEGRTRVIPVIVRECLWKHTSFAGFHALPREAQAITTWDDRDKALKDVVEGLYAVVQEMQK